MFMNMNFLLSLTNDTAMRKGLDEALVLAEANIENSVIIIMPETKTVMAERYLLERSKTGAFSNIYICSYNRLLSKLGICSESYLLSRETGIYIIKKLIQELESDLICYKKASSFFGFAENVYDTITQLKSSGVTPQEFSEVARGAKGALPTKMTDIALLYDAYENYLGERYLDMSDSLTEIAKASLYSNFIKNSHIFILGFESVTAQMDDVISSFVKTARSVSVSASYIHESKNNSHISDNEVFNHYKKVADSLRINYNPIVISENFAPDMKYIAENAFSYPLKQTKGKGNISFYAFSNIQDEIVSVAEEIAIRIRNGQRYRDFGIVLSNIEDYEYELHKIFDEYNIPFFISKKYNLSEHVFFILLKHILEVSRLGYDSSHMIALSKCPLLRLNGNPYEFENYIYRMGVKYNGFLNSFINKDSKYPDEDNLAEEMRLSLIQKISPVVNKLAGAKTVKEFIEIFEEFINREKLESVIEEFAIEQKNLGELEMAAVTEQVLEKAKTSFKTLKEFLGECSTTVEEFEQLLLSGLNSVEISLIPLELDSVVVQPSTDGMADITKLFILGASEGKFPVLQEDCGMIRDSEIRSLSEIFKVKIEPTIKTINRRERYKAFETVLFAGEVQISYSKTNEKLEELTQSSFVFSLASLFQENYIGDEVIISDKKPLKYNNNNIVSGVFTHKNLENKFAQCVGDAKSGNFVSQVDISSMHQVIKDNSTIDFNHMLINNKEEPALNNNKIFFKNGKTSISQLEKYFICPFLHFADYGLALKDRSEIKMQAIDVGDVLHKIAELFVKKYIKNNNLSNNDYEEIINEVLLSNNVAVEHNRMLTNILHKESYRMMNAIHEQLNRSKFKPIAVEAWFGENGKFKPINLASNIKIEGKIDRVDKFNEFYRVIDYKTGKIDENPETLYYGKKVQLLSYIQAIQNSNGNMSPAGALYFPVRNEWAESKKKAEEAYKNKGYLLKDEEVLVSMDNDLYSSNTSKSIPVRFIKAKGTSNPDERDFGAEGNLLTSDQFKNVTDYILAIENQAISEIIQGYITPSPIIIGGKNPCAYCDYKGVCGLDKLIHHDGRKGLENIKFENFIKGE